jgi:hypothetical protein
LRFQASGLRIEDLREGGDTCSLPEVGGGTSGMRFQGLGFKSGGKTSAGGAPAGAAAEGGRGCSRLYFWRAASASNRASSSACKRAACHPERGAVLSLAEVGGGVRCICRVHPRALPTYLPACPECSVHTTRVVRREWRGFCLQPLVQLCLQPRRLPPA